MPGPITDMGREYVAVKTAETLAMDDIEALADFKCGCRGEGEHRGEQVLPPSRDVVEMDILAALALDVVGENMYLMFLAESLSQLLHVARLPHARTAIIVHHECDFHSPAGVSQLARDNSHCGRAASHRKYSRYCSAMEVTE